MLLKKSSIAVCSSNNVLSFFIPTSITSSPRPTLQSATSSTFTTTEARSYATTSQGKQSHSSKTDPEIHWPTCANPTPYDIFAIAKGSAYNKTRFYDLVKLYHPDRHHHTTANGLNHAKRLERYRLVIIANDILGDPGKRRAFDLYGAGWAGDVRSLNDIYRRADKAWRKEPGNAAMNATWEDWERWYEQRDGKEKQQPVFMSNASFAAVVLACIAIGGVAQASRADNHSTHIVETRAGKEAAIADALRRQGATKAGKAREDRIEMFVRDREALAWDASSKYDVQEPNTK